MGIPIDAAGNQIYIPETGKVIRRKAPRRRRTDAQQSLAEKLAIERRRKEEAVRKAAEARKRILPERVAGRFPDRIVPAPTTQMSPQQKILTLKESQVHPDSGVQAPRQQLASVFDKWAESVFERRRQFIADEAAREVERRRLLEVERSAAWISKAPMGVRRAEWGLGPPPTLATVLSRSPSTGEVVFDVEDPSHVRWMQRELRRMGADYVPDTGVYDAQTYAALVRTMREEKEAAVTREVDFIRGTLIGLGYLKDSMGLTARQIGEGVFRNEFLATELYKKAVRDWLKTQRNFTLEDMQDAWVRQHFFLPGMVDVSELRWMARLPYGSEKIDGVELDRVLAAHDYEQREAYRLMAAQQEEAAQDRSWWQNPALVGFLDSLATPARWAVNTVRWLDEMTAEDPWALVPFAETKFGREYWDERWRNMRPYEQYRRTAPIACLIEEVFLDPLNLLTFGTIGSLTKVARSVLRGERVTQMGIAGLSIGDDLRRTQALRLLAREAPEAGVARVADRVLGVAERIEDFHPVTGALRGSARGVVGLYRKTEEMTSLGMTADFLRPLMWLHDFPHLNVGIAVELAGGAATRRMIEALGERGLESATDAMTQLRQEVFEWMRNGFGVTVTKLGDETIDDWMLSDWLENSGMESWGLQRFWVELPEKERERLAVDLMTSELEILDRLSDSAPELVGFVENLQSRLFTETGVLTRAGERLQAQLHKLVWHDAMYEMRKAGAARRWDFGGGYLGGVSPDIVEVFERDYLRQRYLFVNEVLMPVLDAHALKQGYDVAMEPGAAGYAKRLGGSQMVKSALRDSVETPNPNWVFRQTFSRRGTIESYDAFRAAFDRVEEVYDHLHQVRADFGRHLHDVIEGGADRSVIDAAGREWRGARREEEGVEIYVNAMRELVGEAERGDPTVAYAGVEVLEDVVDEQVISTADRLRRLAEHNQKMAAIEARRGEVGFEQAMDEVLFPGAVGWEARLESQRFMLRLVGELHEEAEAWQRRAVQLGHDNTARHTAGAAAIRYSDQLDDAADGISQMLATGGFTFKDERVLGTMVEDELKMALGIRDAVRATRRYLDDGIEHVPVEARRLTQAQADRAIAFEVARLQGLHTSEWATRRALGETDSLLSPGAQQDVLDEIARSVRRRFVNAGNGRMVDTAPYISMPRMYAFGQGSDDVFSRAANEIFGSDYAREGVPFWEEFGLGFTEAQAAEVRGLMTGTSLVEIGGRYPKRMSILPWRRFAATRVKLQGEWQSPALRAARAVENDLIGRSGAVPPGGFDPLAQAFAKRREVLKRGQSMAHAFQYKRYGLYLHALSEHQNRFIRYSYRCFRAGTTAWKDAALPLRTAWAVRNTADNAVKTFLAGVRDPRYFFDANGKTMFDVVRIPVLRKAIHAMDQAAGTDVLRWFDAILDSVASIGDVPMGKLLGLHDVELPPEVVGHTFSQSVKEVVKPGEAEAVAAATMRVSVEQAEKSLATQALKHAQNGLKATRNAYWYQMGTRPEQLFRKALFRHEYAKSLREGYSIMMATDNAVAAVNRHLFDYDNPTLWEYNMKLLYPFVTFWARNLPYWADTLVEKPWVLSKYALYSDERDEINAAKPEWMRRYLSVDAVGQVLQSYDGPGAAVTEFLSRAFVESGTDPMNFISVGYLYRQFKGLNPTLTAEEQGVGFFLRVVNALDATGLGMNPFFRKPLELTGVMPPETWRHVFPQTDLVQIFTREYWEDRFPQGLDMEAWLADPLLNVFGRETLSEFNERKLEEAVGLEIAGQVQRGEPVSRQAALDKVETYMAAQTLVGYLVGVYMRHMDAEDIALYRALEAKMADDYVYDPQLYADNPGLRTFESFLRARRTNTLDTVALARWAEIVSMYDRYLETPWGKRDDFLVQNPEVAAYVQAAGDVVHPVSKTIQQVKLSAETERVLPLLEKLWTLNLTLSYDEQGALYEYAVSPGLREYWGKNDTSTEIRQRMIKGVLLSHFLDMQAGFFRIPVEDYEAREAYLRANPLLSWYWNRSDEGSAGELAKRVAMTANAALRGLWSAFMDAGDFDAAEEFLHRYPFIFEFTASQDNILASGDWIYKDMREDSRFRHTWETWAMANPFAAAEVQFWATYYGLEPEKREQFVREFGVRFGFDPYTQAYGAQVSEDLIARIRKRQALYGSRRRGGSAYWAWWYRSIKPLIDGFWALPRDKRQAYLEGHPYLRDYIDSYAKRHATTPWGRAYLKNRFALDAFYTAADGAAYLVSHPDLIHYLLSYTDPEGTAIARAYLEVSPRLERLQDMEPAEQADYLAESPRVLTYLRDFAVVPQVVGEYLKVRKDIGKYLTLQEAVRDAYLEKHPELREYIRMHGTVAPQQALEYLAVEDGLYELFGLKGEDVAIFLRQNPMVLAYLRRYCFSEPTLAARGLAYQSVFPLLIHFGAMGDDGRLEYLRAHPEVIDYFMTFAPRYGVPSDEGVARSLVMDELKEYDALTDRAERIVFLDTHPRVRDFFERYSSLDEDSPLYSVLRDYFRLPAYSRARSAYLDSHPVLQKYFYDDADPEEQAMSGLLDVYFSLSSDDDRNGFLAGHPEIEFWLEERRTERERVSALRHEWDLGDPQLMALYTRYAEMYFPEADRIRRMLASKKPTVELLRRAKG